MADFSCHRSFFSCKDNTPNVLIYTKNNSNNLRPMALDVLRYQAHLVGEINASSHVISGIFINDHSELLFLVWGTRFSMLDAGLSCTKGVWYIYDWDTGSSILI